MCVCINKFILQFITNLKNFFRVSCSASVSFVCPIYGHYIVWFPFVRSFVRSFVRPSVRLSRFRLKFLVEVVIDEVEVQST